MKQFVTLGVILTLAILALTAEKSIVLQSHKNISLQSAAPLSGQVAQSLAAVQGIPPQTPKDFSLKKTAYFQNNTWAVTTIEYTDKNIPASTAVLQKTNGLFKVVMGPGTAFPSSYVTNMPADVARYLNTSGVVYGS